MEITTALEWDSNDLAIWKAFLASKTGLRLLPKIAESVPVLLQRGDTNEILIRSGLVAGFQLALQTALLLAEPEPPAPPAPLNSYPSLTDDSAWNDGNTLVGNKI